MISEMLNASAFMLSWYLVFILGYIFAISLAWHDKVNWIIAKISHEYLVMNYLLKATVMPKCRQ